MLSGAGFVATGGGTAVNIANTTIGGSGVGFNSITANGASANSGVILNNSGAGAFTVIGTTAVDLPTAASFGATNITNRGAITRADCVLALAHRRATHRHPQGQVIAHVMPNTLTNVRDITVAQPDGIKRIVKA